MKFKTYLTEALKAEDYEASIVMGFYELTGRPITDKNPLDYGISDKVFNIISVWSVKPTLLSKNS